MTANVVYEMLAYEAGNLPSKGQYKKIVSIVQDVLDVMAKKSGRENISHIFADDFAIGGLVCAGRAAESAFENQSPDNLKVAAWSAMAINCAADYARSLEDKAKLLDFAYLARLYSGEDDADTYRVSAIRARAVADRFSKTKGQAA